LAKQSAARSLKQIPRAGRFFSVSATFAPAIGPTIGGYLTDYYGWPFVFYVNLGARLLMLAALWYALPRSGRSIISVGQTIHAPATIMGYADSFALIGVILVVATTSLFFCGKAVAQPWRDIKFGDRFGTLTEIPQARVPC
jgi:MFS family permease